MKMNENVSYVSPAVEVVKVAVEKGFEISSPGNSAGDVTIIKPIPTPWETEDAE